MAPEPTQVFVEGRSGWIFAMFWWDKNVPIWGRFFFTRRVFRQFGKFPSHLEKCHDRKIRAKSTQNPYKFHAKIHATIHATNSCRNPCRIHARVCGAIHGIKSRYGISFIWVQAFALRVLFCQGCCRLSNSDLFPQLVSSTTISGKKTVFGTIIRFRQALAKSVRLGGSTTSTQMEKV